MRLLKKPFMAVFAIIVIGFSGLAVNAYSYEKKQPASQSMNESMIAYNDAWKDKMDRMISASNMNQQEFLIIKSKLLKNDMETWTDKEINQGAEDMRHYSDRYISELDRFKQELQPDDAFDMYQQAKRKEIDDKIIQAFEDLLD